MSIQIKRSGVFRGTFAPGRAGVVQQESRGDMPEVATLDGTMLIHDEWNGHAWIPPGAESEIFLRLELTFPNWGDDKKPDGTTSTDDKLLQDVVDILGYDFEDPNYFDRPTPAFAACVVYAEGSGKNAGKQFARRAFIYPYDVSGKQCVDKRGGNQFSPEAKAEGLAALKRIVGPSLVKRKTAAVAPPRVAPPVSSAPGMDKGEAWERFCERHSSLDDAQLYESWGAALNSVAGPLMDESEITPPMWAQIAAA